LGIPSDRILQPLFLGKAERSLDLRTNVCFSHPLLQISHEHDRWNLLNQGTILRLQVRKLRSDVGQRVSGATRTIAGDYIGIFEEDFG